MLKEFCAYVDAVLPPELHIITANEGSAVAVAAGYHLATDSVPLVYMQNSGLGNSVNPLLSLADADVYGLPIVLLVGWRGEPGVKDEPQHVKQGRVTPAMLDAMEIPYWVLDADEDAAMKSATKAVGEAVLRNAPVVLLAREGIFSNSDKRRPNAHGQRYKLSRERALECVVEALPSSATLVSTTGKISRELYELRRKMGQSGASDFLTVGSMGHASQIALGISIAAPEQLVVCIDGDGAVIMHMGGLASVGTVAPKRFLHIVLNNGAHESVGGQPTSAFDIDLSAIAKATAYREVMPMISEESEIAGAIAKMLSTEGPVFQELRVSTGSRGDLGRPVETPKENKKLFADRLRRM